MVATDVASRGIGMIKIALFPVFPSPFPFLFSFLKHPSRIEAVRKRHSA